MNSYNPSKEIKKQLSSMFPNLEIKSVVKKKLNRRRLKYDNGYLIEVVNNIPCEGAGCLYRTFKNNIEQATIDTALWIEKTFKCVAIINT